MPNLIGVSASGVAPTAYTIATLRLALRHRCGQGANSGIIADTEIDTFLEDARVEVNRRKPLYSLLTFTTLTDGAGGVKQRYTTAEANFPASWLGPPRVWWNGGAGTGCSNIGVFGSLGDPFNWILEDIMSNSGRLLAVNEAAIRFATKNYSFLQSYFGGKGWLDETEYVVLEPVPTSTGLTVYYTISIPRFDNVLEVDERYREAFLSLAESKFCYAIAQKQAEAGAVRSGAGKSVQSALGRVYMQQAAYAQGRADALLAVPSGASIVRQRR